MVGLSVIIFKNDVTLHLKFFYSLQEINYLDSNDHKDVAHNNNYYSSLQQKFTFDRRI